MISYSMMTDGQLDDLTEIEEQCFAGGFGRQTFEKELENKIAVYVTAKDGDKTVGYAGMWDICGAADIMNVGVRREYRRQGIAFGMLKCLIEICTARNIFEINLEVRESNAPARRLYEKLGFRESGLRKGYYNGKENAVLMKLVLLEESTNENTCD